MSSGIAAEQDAGKEVRLPTPADDNGEKGEGLARAQRAQQERNRPQAPLPSDDRHDDAECCRRERKVERAQRRHQLGGRDRLAPIEKSNRDTLYMRKCMKQ